jgi:hypothetical protein
MQPVQELPAVARETTQKLVHEFAKGDHFGLVVTPALGTIEGETNAFPRDRDDPQAADRRSSTPPRTLTPRAGGDRLWPCALSRVGHRLRRSFSRRKRPTRRGRPNRSISQPSRKQLDPGATPTVLDLVPAALVERSNRVLEGVPAAAIDEVLRWSEACDGVVLCAAIGVLQSDEVRATACGSATRDLRVLVDRQVRRRPRLSRSQLRERRGRWLGEGCEGTGPASRPRAWRAALLREHGKDAAATELLARLGDLDAATTWRMRDEVIRRLGDRATTFDWLQHARAALVNLDLERAEASVRAAYRAGVLPSVAARRYVAQGLFELAPAPLGPRSRHAESAKQPGFSGQIAKLRLLQAANPDAAVDESRQLATASVAHALPFSILASAAAVEENVA